MPVARLSRSPRRARLRALAKINLSLLVLNKRSDGFHDLRTVFQTISLADTIDIEFTPGRGREVTLESELDIADNLIVRAANLTMDECGIRGRVRFRLDKTIPMGAGLGEGRAMPRRFCWRCRCWPGFAPTSRGSLSWQPSLAAMFRFSCMAGQPLALSAGPNSILFLRLPNCPYWWWRPASTCPLRKRTGRLDAD